MNARPIVSVVFMIGLLTMLLACSPDPCSYGNDLPTCQAGKVVAQQTIAVSEATRQAVDRASAMRATQDAIALRAQGTQGAINSQATSIAVEQAATRGAESVQAQATRQAVELEALRNSIVMSATHSAMVIDATRQAISADATRTAIDGETRVVQADVQKSVAGLQAGIVLVGITGLFVAGIVMLIWYGRRLAQAGVHGVEVRTSIVRYGPNNSHWALVSPGKDGQKNVLLTDSMIGPHSLSNGALSTLHQLSVPDQVKLLALIEQEKRAKLVLAAQAVGRLPTATIERVTTAADQTPITAQITSPAGGKGLPVAPSFMNLITAWRPSPVQMMLGYGSSGPIYGGMEDMLSIGVVGRPKTGKTTILRFIYAQCVIVGAQVVVWDMHRNIVKDLPGANAYTQLTAIERSAQMMAAELKRRIEAEEYEARDLMILIDEFPLLSRASADVVEVVGRVVLEGRKVHIYVMVAGQGFPASLFGGTLVRDAFNSRYVCHTSTKQAQMAGLDNESAGWVRTLPRGYAVLDGPVDPQIIAIPNTSREDLTALLPASVATSRATSGTSGATSTTENRSGNEGEAAGDGEGAFEVDEIARERVREMLKSQIPVSRIVKQLWGVSGGDAYQKKAAELRAIMASLVQ